MIKKLSLYTLALLGGLVLFNSCKKEYETIETLDERTIADYIKNNNLTNVKDTLGYHYQIITPGAGVVLLNSDSVYYTYDFKHTDGRTIIKNGDYQIPGTFLGYTDRFGFLTIPSVRFTLSKLKRGGAARVIVPSRLAFGKNGNTTLGVGSNEVIVIELALLAESKQYQIDNLLINKFVAANKLQTTVDPGKRVQYIVSNVGTGKEDLKASSTVKVKYTGRLLNGTVFDSSADGVEFKLDEVIKGWTETLPGKIGVGGKIRLLIPSDLAYGEKAQTDINGKVSIPGNSSLDFDIEIVSITNK
jgi:FKBP-type peptidyl-prolyl cis-trans isomerase FkpA